MPFNPQACWKTFSFDSLCSGECGSVTGLQASEIQGALPTHLTFLFMPSPEQTWALETRMHLQSHFPTHSAFNLKMELHIHPCGFDPSLSSQVTLSWVTYPSKCVGQRPQDEFFLIGVFFLTMSFSHEVWDHWNLMRISHDFKEIPKTGEKDLFSFKWWCLLRLQVFSAQKGKLV